MFEVPANALQVAVGRTVSATSANGRVPQVVAGSLLIEASAFGAGACAVLLALSPVVESFLHLPSITSALLLGAYALPIGLSVVPKGVLAGQGRWPLLSTGLLAGMAVRLVVGVVLVRRGGGLEGAFVAMVWGELVTAVIVLIGFRRLVAHPVVPGPSELVVTPADDVAPSGHAPPHLGWGQAKVAAFAFTGYWALTAVDVVLARHWLGPTPRVGTRQRPRWPKSPYWPPARSRPSPSPGWSGETCPVWWDRTASPTSV